MENGYFNRQLGYRLLCRDNYCIYTLLDKAYFSYTAPNDRNGVQEIAESEAYLMAKNFSNFSFSA